MLFEFEYDVDTDEISIVYDGSFVLKVEFDGDNQCYHNFDKLPDEDTEKLLKNLCKDVRKLLA